MLCGGIPVASAQDSFHGTRTQTLVERQHSAVLTLGKSGAELVVRRSVWNAGAVSDQAMFMIHPPKGAVATRLRSRGTGPSAPWFEGELLEAEEAAAKYKSLTGIGGYYPKDPALLSWRQQGLLALQVFPCPPHSEKIVEYTLELPFVYQNGQRHVTLSALGTQALPARVQVFAKDPRDSLSVDGKSLPNGGVLPAAGDAELDISLATRASSLEAELVSLPFASGRVLTHFELRASPELSKLPKQAYVVLLVDASRSTGDDFEQAAKSALDAYLSLLPDAHVEVITFDRNVHRQLGRFGASDAARYALSVLSLGKLNGSDVDHALFEADQLLATTPPGAPRRIVVVTDGLARSTLTPQRLRGAAAQSGAIVHLGLLSGGSPGLTRVDDHPWSEAIGATGGVLWSATAPAETQQVREQHDALLGTYEEWARPLRIDRINAFSDNSSLVNQLPDTLKEGQGDARLYVDSSLTHQLSIMGELWSSPIKVMASADEQQDARFAALVFGSDVLSQLSDAEMMTLALKGRAVSPVTSYLAIEPGVRPSTEGLTDEQGGIGFGGAKVRMGGTKLSRGRARPLDLQAFLEDQLATAFTHCGGVAGESAPYVELETTLDEIVKVDVNSSTGDALEPLLAACLSEATWSIQLPEAFEEDWASFNVNL